MNMMMTMCPRINLDLRRRNILDEAFNESECQCGLRRAKYEESKPVAASKRIITLNIWSTVAAFIFAMKIYRNVAATCGTTCLMVKFKYRANHSIGCLSNKAFVDPFLSILNFQH